MSDRRVRRTSDDEDEDEDEIPPSIMKRKEGEKDRRRKGHTPFEGRQHHRDSQGGVSKRASDNREGRSRWREEDPRRRHSTAPEPSRMSIMSSGHRDSGVEARGLASFARSGGSWETDWNASTSRDRSRASRSVAPTYRPRQSIGRLTTEPRSWNNAPTVHVEQQQKDAPADDTDPDELLQWTTEARNRDVDRQEMLDQRRKLQLDDYNPDAHREHLVLISDLAALAITLNSIVGSTFVGLPMAFVRSGLLVGSLGIFVMASCVSYTMHILIRWRYEVLKILRRPWAGYPKTMDVAIRTGPPFLSPLAPLFKVFVHILFIPYLIFSTAMQCILMAAALQKIMEYYGHDRDIRAFIALLLIPLLPISLIPNLRIMAIESIFGIIAAFVACILIITAIMIDRTDTIITGELISVSLESPLYLIVTLSTLQSVAQLMCVESHMKHRKHFLGYFGVMNRALIVVTCTYLLLGSIAYAQYANDTKSNILDNLTIGPLEIAACVVFMFSVWLTYPVNIFTVYDFAWEIYLRRRLHGFPKIEKTLWGYVVRISVCIFSVILAIIFVIILYAKYFIMSVCLPLLILVFPPVIELTIAYKRREYGPRGYRMWLDLTIIAFGLATLVLSLRAYIEMYGQHK